MLLGLGRLACWFEDRLGFGMSGGVCGDTSLSVFADSVRFTIILESEEPPVTFLLVVIPFFLQSSYLNLALFCASAINFLKS